MSMLTLEDIVSVDHHRFSLRSFRRRGRHPERRPSRREFVHGTVAVGAAMSVGALSWLPTARPASAEHGSWKIWSGCGGLGSWVDNDDCRGCNQGSVLCCCVNGYHRADGCHYAHRPDKCHSGGYDGWTWSTSICCFVSASACGAGCIRGYTNRRWRCSDGYYRSNCDNGFQTSICRYVVGGGSTCSPCAC